MGTGSLAAPRSHSAISWVFSTEEFPKCTGDLNRFFFWRKQDFLSPFLISKTCLMFTHFNIYTEAVYGASSTCCPPHPCHWFLSPINSSSSIFFSGNKIFWPFLIEIKRQTDAGRLNHRETPTTLHLVRICCADSSLATFLTVFFLVYTIKGK